MEKSLEEGNETFCWFSNLYKYNGKNFESSQQQRRDRLLQAQREKRHQVTDTNRQQCELFIQEMGILEEMECDLEKTSTKKPFKFQLMYSEWFTEIPDDLEENWFVKFCPEGFRVLLVARRNNTICYNSHGKIVLKIKSNFPGGGGCESQCEPNGNTVLDCIYNKKTKSIFILDCLFWNSMSTLDSEVDFRFYWLASKFQENPQFTQCHQYSFMLLEYMPAQRPLIQDQMFSLFSVGTHHLPFDGVVFYHKESHYTFGYTPLVGWLASYMLPEKLNIDVSPENMVKKPKNYICLQQYIETINDKKLKKKRNKEKHGEVSEMEF